MKQVKNKKLKKFTRISLGSLVAISTPLALVYSINAIRGQGQKNNVVETSSVFLKTPLTADEVKDKIFEGKILDLSVEQLMRIIRAIKSDEKSEIKSLLLFIYPQVIDHVKKIDNSSFRLIFEIILNKGISNISNEDISIIVKVIKKFVNIPEKFLNYLKYIPVFVNKGLNSILFANDNEIINKFLPQITSYVAKKLVKKPARETDGQKASRLKKEQDIQKDIENIIRKLLIDGYKAQTSVLAIRQMAKDITNLVYKLTNKIPKDFFGIVKSKPVVEDLIFYLIDSVFTPIRDRIENKRKAIDQEIVNLKQKIQDVEIQNTQLSSKSGSSEVITQHQYDQLMININSFKSSAPLSHLMYELGVTNVDLQYVKNNYTGRKNVGLSWWPTWRNVPMSDYKWYEREYNAYYLLAIAYGHKNLDDDEMKRWRSNVKSEWIKGVNNKGIFGITDDPNHEPIDKLMKKQYGSSSLKTLKNNYDKIKQNIALIKANKNTRIVQPTGYNKKDLYKVQIKDNHLKIDEYKRKILDLQSEKINLLRSRIYQFEINNNITKEVLMKNGLINSIGLLKLSRRDLGNFLYKVQDLVVNVEIYLNTSIDKVIATNALIGLSSTILSFGGYNVKNEILKLVLPAIKANLTPDLLSKIQKIDTENVAQITRGILDKGLPGINSQTIVTTTNLIKTFAPSVDLIFERNIWWNILRILKNGLKFLPISSQVLTIHKIIDASSLSNSLKKIIKGYIKG